MLRLRALPVLLMALLSATLAGCVETGDESLGGGACPPSTLDQPGVRLLDATQDPIDDDIDNATVFATTNVRTCSLPAIGWDPLGPDGTPHKYLGELDMRGDLGLGAVAVVGSGEPGGVYVVSIADRADPKVLAWIPQPGAHVTDVKISDDGKVLYVASQNTPQAELTSSLPEPVSPAGFTVYSLADPQAPAYMGTVVDGTLGCHMLEPVQVSPTQDAVMCVSSDLRSYLIDRSGPFVADLGFVDYVPTKGGVPTPGAIPLAGDPTCSLPAPVPSGLPGACLLGSAPHDMTVYHEGGAFGNGSSYLVVSHWDQGLKVLDITDAPAIAEVGAWSGEGAAHYDGNVHTAMMFQSGGHRYIMASPEYTSAGNVPGLWVLDADDLAHLQLVGEWYHPGQHESQGLFLTTHQWQVAPTGPAVDANDTRVYLTYNHAGVWVLDLGAILRGDDQGAILGYNLARTPIPEEHVPNAILSTWDVNVVDGYIYGTDRATGLWVFHYLGDQLGDPAVTGFA